MSFADAALLVLVAALGLCVVAWWAAFLMWALEKH